MIDRNGPTIHELWARTRFSVVGPLFAAPPAPGELAAEIERLAAKTWRHPVTGEPTRFGASTIERWYYLAKKARIDPLTELRKKIRSDSGTQPSMGEKLRQAIIGQHRDHRSWSYKLHYDNLRARIRADSAIGPAPSYATLRRYMKSTGLIRRRKISSKDTDGVRKAYARLDAREVRSYESAHVNALWHLDFHHGSRKVLTRSGELVTPLLLGVLDDRSRLCCHLQWYYNESAENLVHGLSQAIQKRGLPRALMTDNGSAMKAAETCEGLARLGILHERTLDHSPYQNGKQESFWGPVEGRLIAMIEGHEQLELGFLNELTQAWVEFEYHREVHSETGQTPLERFLAGPDVGRPSPDSDSLRKAFCRQESRTQRRSDGTVSVEGRRFEVPGRFRHLDRILVRWAEWDLSCLWQIDERTGVILGRLFPLDREKNSDGIRRALDPITQAPEETCSPSGLAPLLEELLAKSRATGLAPPYLPKDETARTAGLAGAGSKPEKETS